MRTSEAILFAKGWAFWTCLAAVCYVLAFCPVVWLSMRLDPFKHQRALRVLGLSYRPVVIAIAESPPPMKHAAEEFLQLGAPSHVEVIHGPDRGLFWNGPGYTYTFLSY